MESVLITGGSGRLGSRLMELASEYKVVGTYIEDRPPSNLDYVKMDITKINEIETYVNKLKPCCIIHTAAITDVDLCETNKDLAWSVNVEGTRNLVEVSRKNNIKMIYISTDFVFDGKTGMYKENDIPNPISYYGLTKLEGEKIVKILDDWTIARLSVLYGWILPFQKPNFVTWIIEKLKKNEKINLVTDQFSSPTFVDNCAEALIKILESNRSGIFHTAGKERISRFDFAVKVAKTFDLDEKLITPITTDKLKQIAKRPADSSLDISNTEKELRFKFYSIYEGLNIMKRAGKS